MSAPNSDPWDDVLTKGAERAQIQGIATGAVAAVICSIACKSFKVSTKNNLLFSSLTSLLSSFTIAHYSYNMLRESILLDKRMDYYSRSRNR
jgi:hypothetical protein